jgi:hypothetical protein
MTASVMPSTREYLNAIAVMFNRDPTRLTHARPARAVTKWSDPIADAWCTASHSGSSRLAPRVFGIARNEREQAVVCCRRSLGTTVTADAMRNDPTPSDPAEQLASLQDQLYDLVVTRVTQAPAGGLRRLRRDAQEAAALAEDLADAALRVADGDSHAA